MLTSLISSPRSSSCWQALGDREARTSPLGEPVLESPSRSTASSEQTDGVISEHAERPTAVGDHLDPVGQRADPRAKVIDGDRAGTDDVAGGELGVGADVEDDEVAGIEAGGDLVPG